MTPQEDAGVLLALVDRHLRALRLNLDPADPDEEWGFTAQQAVEKLDPRLLALQPYAVEARYEAGPFPLSASRMVIMAAIERLRDDAVRGIGEE